LTIIILRWIEEIHVNDVKKNYAEQSWDEGEMDDQSWPSNGTLHKTIEIQQFLGTRN
jgi:hypothetical protein